jgi:hypothetical protein
MHPKRFALVMGIIFLVMGALAFVPTLNTIPPGGLPALRIEESYALFLDAFAMNFVNKVFLIVLGIAGIMAFSARFTNLPKSISFSRWTFFLMALLSVLGMIPETNTLFGYMPLYGNQVWMNGIFALLGLYFGYAFTMRAHTSPPVSRTHTPGYGKGPLTH